MKRVTIEIPDYLYEFYEKIGQNAGVPFKQVLVDALFRLADMMSRQILSKEDTPVN